MRDAFDLLVIGAGASGLTAAISGARGGASAVVLERLPRAGKKLLATGGGRCNLLNDSLSASAFKSMAPGLVSSVFKRFGQAEIRGFFEGLGLRLQTDESGRVYPATNQAASVLKVLELETVRLGVAVKTGFEVERIDASFGGYSVAAADGRKIAGRRIVLAGGGRSYPALGSNGSCYGLAEAFGHRIVSPVPSAVPLLVRDWICHVLQGQRLRARIESRVGGRPGRTAEGELLFTQYGLSGTAVLDVSESLSIALNRDGQKNAAVVVDLVPDMSQKDMAGEFARRLEAGWAVEDLAAGILPEKFAMVLPRLLREAGLPDVKGKQREAAQVAAAALKSKIFSVQGTRGWNEAEFTSGGVDARDVMPRTLESRLRKGLYFAGEVLDVQGGRGGYNLAWAWASGYVAGLGE